MIRKSKVLVAGTAALALSLSIAACGGSDDTDGSTSSSKAEFNAAMTKVFNPSEKKGGTIKLANSGDWDTLDPGETYYGYSWNFLRLYGRGLLMFKPVPGAEGNTVTPDLAEGLGVPSDVLCRSSKELLPNASAKQVSDLCTGPAWRGRGSAKWVTTET